MTRQKSLFSKNLFFEDIKQNKHIMILYTVLLLLCTTLPAMIIYNNYLETSHFYLLSDCAEILSMANPFVTLLNCGAAFIFVLLQFGYLYKSSSVIFYHSMPITRQNMLITKFLSGFVCMLIPIILAFTVNLSLNVIIGFQFWVSVSQMVKILCAIVLTTLFTYSVVTFAQTLCSNVFALVISVSFIFLLYPITKAVAVGTFIAYMPTYRVGFDLPLADYIYPMWITFSKNDLLKMFTAPFAIYLIVMPVILVALSAFIYSKRKSENTNKFFAFDVVNKFLKYYITICLTFGLGTILRSTVNSMNLVITFVIHIVAVVLIFSILQAIFDKNIRNMFANKKKMLLISALILLVVTALEVDIFKIDKMVPDVDKTDEIRIYMPLSINDSYRYYTDEITLTDKKSIEAAVNLLKLGEIERNRSWTRDDDIISLRLYTPKYDKWGVSRSFLSNGADFEKFYAVAFDTKEYKEQVYNLDDHYIPPNNKYAMQIGLVDHINGGANYFYIENEADKAAKIIDILKQEAYKATYEDIKDKKVKYVIDYQYKVERDDGGYIYNYRDVPVFENFEETVKMLDEIYNAQQQEQ